jgi:hypothetical protein
VKAIAKLLNAQGATSPRAQRGRSQSWAPTSVRAILYRPVYRGEIIWAQTAKRDKWGRKRQSTRSESEWIKRPAPALQIVSDEEWAAAHARLEAVRGVYLTATNGNRFGRERSATRRSICSRTLRCAAAAGDRFGCARGATATAESTFTGAPGITNEAGPSARITRTYR